MKATHTHACPIAAALNIFGDKWTLLIVREAFYGENRFGDFLKNTGISRNLLTERLNHLVSHGILARSEFADRGTKYIYKLTDKGRSLETILISMVQWGNDHIYEKGAEPMLLWDRRSDSNIAALRPCLQSGEPVAREDLMLVSGPGASRHVQKRLALAGAQRKQ
mgnify:CR=1 FL=1